MESKINTGDVIGWSPIEFENDTYNKPSMEKMLETMEDPEFSTIQNIETLLDSTCIIFVPKDKNTKYRFAFNYKYFKGTFILKSYNNEH